jgi:hypothetical protein
MESGRTGRRRSSDGGIFSLTAQLPSRRLLAKVLQYQPTGDESEGSEEEISEGMGFV